MNQATKLVKREDEPGEIDRRFDGSANYRGPVYGYGPESSEGEVHLLDYWRAIRKRLWLVLGVAALITALSTIYVARKADVYEASSRVQVDLENNPMYAGKSVPMIYSPVNDPAYFNTQLQILTSPGLLRRVVKTLDLEHNQAFLRPQSLRQPSTWKTVLQMWGVSGPEKKETNTSTGEFLSKRVAELQQQIRADEEKLVSYAKNNQILSLDASQNTVVERLAGLNKQLLEAENDRKMAEAEYNAAKAPGAATALAEAGAKDINESESKLADLKQKRAQLLVDATEEAPEVKEVDQQIAELQKHLNASRARNTNTLLTNLETKYRQSLAREESLRKSFNQQKGETVTQNEAAINYRILQQEIETNKGLLDNLLQRSKENDVVLAGRPNNISVVDYAITPDFPVGPARMRSVMLAFVLALALGVGLALFLEYLDDSIHSTDDVEKFLRLPALAVIPSMSGGVTRRRLLSSATALQKRNGNNGGNPELLLNVNGRSALAE